MQSLLVLCGKTTLRFSYPGKTVFVLCCTSNPYAISLQRYPTDEAPFYLQIVKESRNWGTPEQLGLEVELQNLMF